MFSIQSTPCLRCGQRPVAQVTSTELLCFNCRFVQPAPDALEYPFTKRELQRLAIYRAAMRAGFYSDYPNRCCS